VACSKTPSSLTYSSPRGSRLCLEQSMEPNEDEPLPTSRRGEPRRPEPITGSATDDPARSLADVFGAKLRWTRPTRRLGQQPHFVTECPPPRARELGVGDRIRAIAWLARARAPKSSVRDATTRTARRLLMVGSGSEIGDRWDRSACLLIRRCTTDRSSGRGENRVGPTQSISRTTASDRKAVDRSSEDGASGTRSRTRSLGAVGTAAWP
jgi:hypothetical protein